MTNRANTERGFTLVEMMVALFILGLISAAGANLLFGATSASKNVRAQEERVRQIDIAQALIRNDIMAMQERASRADYGFGAPINLIGESAPSPAPLMQFIRAGWANPSAEKRSDLQAVSYRLTDGQLVRAVWLRPDATSTTPVSNRVLLDNVVRVEMRFMRGGQSSREWNVSRRTTLDILPELIEMIIVFADGNTLTIAALTGARQ